MFCTDVLRAKCSLKDFFHRPGPGVGFRCSGREMGLIRHTELGRLEVSVLSWWLYGKWHTIWSMMCVWSLSTSVHTHPLLLPCTSSKSIQTNLPTFRPATYLCINPPPPPSLVVLSASVLCWSLRHSRLRRPARWVMQSGREGRLAELPPEGRGEELTRPDRKLRESTGAINCRGSVGCQCPLCRWGTSCWWPATGPHTPGGRGACRVISCGHRWDTVGI